MGRPRKLDKDAEAHIRFRVEIAQATGLFSRNELANGFSVSVMTLRRYHSEKDRRASQVLALRAYERSKLVKRGFCEDCNKRLGGHLRCRDCGILIHIQPKVCRCGAQHGITLDAERCLNCFDMAIKTSVYL